MRNILYRIFRIIFSGVVFVLCLQGLAWSAGFMIAMFSGSEQQAMMFADTYLNAITNICFVLALILTFIINFVVSRVIIAIKHK